MAKRDNDIDMEIFTSSNTGHSSSDNSLSSSFSKSSSQEVWNRHYNNDENTDVDSDEILQRYQNILGQFISVSEMKALSWRYGL